MRSVNHIILTLLASFSILSVSAREVIDLNGGWRFSYGAGFDRKMSDVTLPHSWNGGGGISYFGIGSYLKEITVPQEWAHNKRIYLRVGAASNTAVLLVNGRYAGEHRGGFSPFTIDITPYINFGVSNSILIMVDNASQTDVIPLSSDRSFYGGLYRGCRLIVTDADHISVLDDGTDGVRLAVRDINDSEAMVDARIMFDGTPGADLNVTLDLYAPSDSAPIHTSSATVRIGDNGMAELTMPFSVENPVMWNGIENPFLYEAVVTMNNDGGAFDRVRLPLGLRTVGADRDGGFMLNGRPYELRGVILHQDRSGKGAALSRRDIEEDVRMILEMGANAVRLTDGTHDEYFYDLCDANGIVVWSDLPLNAGEGRGGKGFIDSYAFKDNATRQLEEMISQLERHPSVVMLGIFSNIRSVGDNPQGFLRELNDYAKEQLPDRLTVCSSIEDGSINTITDLVSWAQYFGWESGDVDDYLKWADQFKKGWRDLMPGVGEYGAGGDITVQGPTSTAVRASSEYHPESYQAWFHERYADMIDETPYFWGTFINSMFDYGRPRYTTDGKDICDMGLVTFDRHVPKDAYYVYKALWSDEPFVHIAEKRNDKTTGFNRKVKVYTNLDSVELTVNGKSVGSLKPVRGRAVWDVTLQPGVNTIAVASGAYGDEVTVEAFSDVLHKELSSAKATGKAKK